MSNSQLSVLIQRQAEKYGDRVALKYRDYDTETWVPVSWKQFAETVTTTSNALLELGVGVQENIGVFSQNKPECLYVDFGAFGIRAVTIPFYATSSEAQVLYDAGDLHSGQVRDRPVCPGRQPEAVCRRAEGKDLFPQRGHCRGRYAAGVSRGASRHDGTFVPDAKVAGTDAGHRRDRPDSGGLHRRDARPAHQQRHPAE